jgi:hypothetical protein
VVLETIAESVLVDIISSLIFDLSDIASTYDENESI